MQVFKGLPTTKLKKSTVITMGTFDGVHVGHRAIINKLKDKAQELRGYATVVTFEPHPQIVIQRKDRPKIHLLTTTEEKIELLSDLGVDVLVILNFENKLAALSAATFIDRIFYKGLGARHIIIGYDHHFGKNREGSAALLSELGNKYEFAVETIGPITAGETVVSSTKIRHYLENGDVAAASCLLGRNYSLCGIVIKGDGRGRSLGFPTANLQLLSKDKLIPGDGIYAVLVHIGHISKKGILNIGRRPTFNSTNEKGKKVIEAHIFDFEKDLYNQQICVEFIGRIREEKHFSSPVELSEQIRKDKEKSFIFFNDFERSL